jgi:hypothetical protein
MNTHFIKPLNNSNGRCFQPNNYIDTYKWKTKEFYNEYALNFRVNQLKILMNGSISFKVNYPKLFIYK